MKMTGEEVIAAPRQVVWNALNDPDILKQCITGCEEVKKKSDTEFEAKVTVKVGPVKASFVGEVKLSKLNPPRSYVISGEGKGGVAGFAKGGATINLSDTGDAATKLSYDVEAQVGGKLAQIGSRLIDSTAKKMATDFFKKFNKIMSKSSEDTEMKEKSPTKKATAKKPAAKAAKTAAKEKTVTKAAAKPAAKAAKAAAKPAAKTTAAASTAAATETATAKTVSGGAEAAKSTAAVAKPEAKSAATIADQQVDAVKKNAGDNIPPQVKSMSRMWTWVMLAAAAGIVLLWATGK